MGILLRRGDTGLALALVLFACCAADVCRDVHAAAIDSQVDERLAGFMVVDCLLPGQVRQLGRMRYVAARKAIRTTAAECETRGGEFVAYDRATRASSLKVWLPLAEEGDAEAQNQVGEIFEKGMGLAPDFGVAAVWYLRAAEQGSTRAAVNLGNLFEQGLGVEQDRELAAYWYRRASGVEELIRPAPAVTVPSETSILLVEPPVQVRGGVGKLVGAQYRDGDFPLVGQVTSSRRIQAVLVDGAAAQLIGDTLFRAQVGNLREREDFEITVRYQDGGHEVLKIVLVHTSQSDSPRVEDLLPTVVATINPSGRQHALIIGNDSYQQLVDLDTAIRDARAIAAVLRDLYGFEVTLIEDVTRYDALSAINALRQRFGPDDQLLVYYAGHGELDRINHRGHWLPVDAEVDSMANWISNITITDLLNTLPARQLLVIADSCYSGMMSRSSLGVIDREVDRSTRARLLTALAGSRTRTALTSGGVTPVLDGGGEGHSVFARVLLDVLRANPGTLTGFELYRALAQRVTERAMAFGVDQRPEYAPLQFAGHEGGDFVLTRRQMP